MKRKFPPEAVKRLLRHGVDVVLLFGSQIAGTRRSDSDFDIGVAFHDERERLKDPVTTYGDLHAVFQKQFSSKKIDLVYLRECPVVLQFRAAMEGKLLYASSPTAYASFREEIMRRYFDFKPVEDLFNRAFLGQPA